MKTGIKTIFALLAAACAFSASPAAAGAGSYKDLSARIIKFSEANALKKIAVLEFSAKGGAGRTESEYAAEKISLYLAGSKGTALIERALISRVLAELRLSAAAGGAVDEARVLKSMLSLDAVVAGTVFADGGTLKVLARLIDLKTGRVLLAAEAEEERLPTDPLDGGFSGMEPPAVTFPELPAGWGSAGGSAFAAGAVPGDLRDAVADPAGRPCGERRRQLAELNSELVDAKARYWALKMKAKGFSLAGLKRNPGSEISDAAVKARFYRLLTAYYRRDAAEPPDPVKISAVLDLLKLEAGVSDDCGLY